MDAKTRDNLFGDLLADGAELPWGFEPYSWHWFPSGGLGSIAKDSKLHLRREGDEHGDTLCGLNHRFTTRKGLHMRRRNKCHASNGRSDHVDALRNEGACTRCWLRALETIHVLRLRSHRTGVSNRYGRGSSGSGGVNTHGHCSCGWAWTANSTKRDAEQAYRDHLRDACFKPQFSVVSLNTGETIRVGTASQASAALGPGGYEAVGWDALVKDPTAEAVVKYGGTRDDLMLRVQLEHDAYLEGGDPRDR